ncbi:MAG TPA: peptidylprolyl isomerase [Burkholderiales bacterium]|nr:peptidylprolyl isomerase [Burkholderiales bacterium]
MRNIAKPLLFVFVICVPCVAARAAEEHKASAPLLLDRTVAVVNNEVLTKVDLDDQVKMAMLQLKRQGTPPPAADALEKQLLERMITSRILVQTAKETGLRVEDAQLQRAIERIAEENKMTPDQFRKSMEDDGVNFNRFREELRNEILVTRLKEREVDSKIVITDAEIDGYLRNQTLQGGKDDEYNLAHILILVPEGATPEQIQAKRAIADRALAQLQAGADFRQVSASFSDAQNALEGGPLGWRTTARLPEMFVDAVKGLKVGEVSQVLRSPNGFHILKLLDKRGNESPVIVQQTHARHILIRTSEVVSENEAKHRLEGLRERVVLGNADFGELARQHSEDASATKGGDLGWLSPGDTVPEFEHAMNALKPGEVSEPVRTSFGWHLIQVLERRDEDMSKERQRVLARQAIRQRKSDEAYQEWVRLQRDKAYVEYRLEDH